MSLVVQFFWNTVQIQKRVFITRTIASGANGSRFTEFVYTVIEGVDLAADTGLVEHRCATSLALTSSCCVTTHPPRRHHLCPPIIAYRLCLLERPSRGVPTRCYLFTASNSGMLFYTKRVSTTSSHAHFRHRHPYGLRYR